MKLKIGIDIADTIIDVWPNMLKLAQEYNDKTVQHDMNLYQNYYLPEDIFSWDDKTKSKFWTEYRSMLTFYMPIKKGVQETLTLFRSLDIGIYFITAKSNREYLNLENRIVKLLNNNNIPFDQIFLQVENKGKLCKQEGISYLIDDSYTNCLLAVNNGVTGLLMSAPYNCDRDLVDNMYRITEFENVKKYILKK